MEAALKQSLWDDPWFWLRLCPVTAAASRHFFARSPAIGARAIFPIYAKTTVALAKAAYRPAPKKICE